MKREVKPVLVSDEEILRFYWSGYTIDRLVRFVSGNERCTKGEAKKRVEAVIYQDAMMRGGNLQ